MSTPTPLAPSREPEATVLDSVIARHAAEAGFLWHLRDAAAVSPGYSLDDLRKLDERLEANLDGLVIAGEIGQAMCADELADGEAGEVFAAAVVALRREDRRAFGDVLARSVGSQALLRGLVSGLGWAPLDQARGFLLELLAGEAAELYFPGIAGCAGQRFDPGEGLREAVLATEPRLKARALRAAGELGRIDLLSEVQRAIGDDDEGCAFAAAWAAALLGDTAAHEALWRIASNGASMVERACDMAARRGDPAAVGQRLRALGEDPEKLRAALGGAAALGDPGLVPWLIERMESPYEARRAGWAFTQITGAGLAAQGLEGPRPQGFSMGPSDDPRDPRVAMDPDLHLRFPDVERVRAWWQEHASGLPAGERLLHGKPLTAPWLAGVLRSGNQPARRAAAIELGLAHPGRPLFEVRAPGFRQWRELAGELVVKT